MGHLDDLPVADGRVRGERRGDRRRQDGGRARRARQAVREPGRRAGCHPGARVFLPAECSLALPVHLSCLPLGSSVSTRWALPQALPSAPVHVGCAVLLWLVSPQVPLPGGGCLRLGLHQLLQGALPPEQGAARGSLPLRPGSQPLAGWLLGYAPAVRMVA